MRNRILSLIHIKFQFIYRAIHLPIFMYITLSVACLLISNIFMQIIFAGQNDISGRTNVDVIHSLNKVRIPFIINNGQLDDNVKFYAETFEGKVFINKNGEIVYLIKEVLQNSLPIDYSQGIRNYKYSGTSDFRWVHNLEYLQMGILPCVLSLTKPYIPRNNKNDRMIKKINNRKRNEKMIKSVIVRENLIGGKINNIRGEKKSVTTVSYFKGNDRSKWKTKIPTYETISMGEVYKGIELKLRVYGNGVEKLFCIKPQSNPETIKLRLTGAKDIKLNNAGELAVETGLGIIKSTRPVAYQEIAGEKVEVPVDYQITDSEFQDGEIEYGFKLASYDKTKELIIDPILASTFLGGSWDEECNSIAIDKDGNTYLTGWTLSDDFPVTDGSYHSLYTDCYCFDVFVSKFDGDLKHLLSSTFLGGDANDNSTAICIDKDDNIYITGYTSSPDFPTTRGAYDSSYNGNWYSCYDEDKCYDVFISKFNSDLTKLFASTYLGGTQEDYGNDLTIDSNSNIYVTGSTLSSKFPATAGAYDISYNGDIYRGDVFISKFNRNLTRLVASTFLGGSYDEGGNAIAIDLDGNIYVTGDTGSSDFPVTRIAYDTFNNDIFVSKFNGDLTELIASTFLGGSDYDYSNDIDIDVNGSVYITGSTSSFDFPISLDAYDISYNNSDFCYRYGHLFGGDGDAFVTKLNNNLTRLLASTYLGSSFDDVGNSIAVDSSGNVFIVGNTDSTDFPLTAIDCHNFKFDYNYNYNYYVFISKLSESLTDLLASIYLGGCSNYSDFGNDVAIDLDENVYIVGGATSESFPVTSDAYDTSHNYGYDVFVSKFDNNLYLPTSIFIPPSVKTGTATEVTSNSAVVTGTVNAKNLLTYVWVDYGTTTGLYDEKSNEFNVCGTNSTFLSMYLRDLIESTTYYYRLIAQNCAGISYGDEMSFTTLPSPPPTPFYSTPTPTTTETPIFIIETTATPCSEVFAKTLPATDVTLSSAVLNGCVRGDGDHSSWFEYGTNINSFEKTSEQYGFEGVSTYLEGLIPDTTYYYRLVVESLEDCHSYSQGDMGYIVAFNTRSELAVQKGSISGQVSPDYVKVNLRGRKTKTRKTTYTNENGFFKFEDLDEDYYSVLFSKTGYKRAKKEITLLEGKPIYFEIELVKKGNY